MGGYMVSGDQKKKSKDVKPCAKAHKSKKMGRSTALRQMPSKHYSFPVRIQRLARFDSPTKFLTMQGSSSAPWQTL